jgi:hypothetical protein
MYIRTFEKGTTVKLIIFQFEGDQRVPAAVTGQCLAMHVDSRAFLKKSMLDFCLVIEQYLDNITAAIIEGPVRSYLQKLDRNDMKLKENTYGGSITCSCGGR